MDQRVRASSPGTPRVCGGTASLLGLFDYIKTRVGAPASRAVRLSIIQALPTEHTTLSAAPNPTQLALSLVSDDMHLVDQVIQQRLDSDVPLVGQVSQYIIGAGGKRVRPALLLLMCGALGCTDPRRHALAAIVEFIHTATLLHDDVAD